MDPDPANAELAWFIGRDDLVRNKRATGRPKDIADLEVLEKRPS